MFTEVGRWQLGRLIEIGKIDDGGDGASKFATWYTEFKELYRDFISQVIMDMIKQEKAFLADESLLPKCVADGLTDMFKSREAELASQSGGEQRL